MRALVSPLAQVSDFDLRLLRVFKAVAEAGSFAGAESALGITRSAISLHMADLEQRLGMRLCQRGRAGFALTDQGREVLRSAESLLAAVEDFRTGVNQLHQTLRGDLNIGLMNNLVTLPRMRITAALQAIRQRSDAVRIHLSMSPPGEVERGVLDGRLHAGAVPLITPLSGLPICRSTTRPRSSTAATVIRCSRGRRRSTRRRCARRPRWFRPTG